MNVADVLELGGGHVDHDADSTRFFRKLTFIIINTITMKIAFHMGNNVPGADHYAGTAKLYSFRKIYIFFFSFFFKNKLEKKVSLSFIFSLNALILNPLESLFMIGKTVLVINY